VFHSRKSLVFWLLGALVIAALVIGGLVVGASRFLGGKATVSSGTTPTSEAWPATADAEVVEPTAHPTEIAKPTEDPTVAPTAIAVPPTPTLTLAITFTPQPTAMPQITATRVLDPVIHTEPSVPVPGARVAIRGKGFPAEAPLVAQLGLADDDKTSQSFVEGTTDTSGEFSLAGSMPTTWADGSPITEKQLALYVVTSRGWYAWVSFPNRASVAQ